MMYNVDEVTKQLEFGEITKARAAFDKLQEQVRLLDWRLRDAEEAEELTESVYAASVHPDDRWRKPQVSDQRAVKIWSPGRVKCVDKKYVYILVSYDGTKRVVEVRMSHAKWSKATGGADPSTAEGFFEMQKMHDGTERIILLNPPMPPWSTK